MEKHNHYQEQLELSHQKLQHVEALGDKEHIRKTQDKYHTLAEKTKEIGYKVGDASPQSALPSWTAVLMNRPFVMSQRARYCFKACRLSGSRRFFLEVHGLMMPSPLQSGVKSNDARMDAITSPFIGCPDGLLHRLFSCSL